MSNVTTGATVRLKSGGPLMTVEQTGRKAFSGDGEHDHAWCQWFEKNKLTTGVFPFASLDIEG